MLLSLAELQKKYELKLNGVMHIGAHYGEEFPHYHNLGIKNMVFFEPVKANFEELKKRLRTYNPLMFNIALGNENKNIKMFVESVNQGQSSSILQPVKHLTQYPKIVFDKEEIVKMVRLDDFIKTEKHVDKTQYNFLNIDVQGYELEVLKGAEELLKTIDYIYTEVNKDELYKDCVKIEKLDGFLGLKGFERVETNWEGIIWGDALYIKKNNNKEVATENKTASKAKRLLQSVPYVEDKARPKLSIVIVGRNDNHNSDFLIRLKNSVKQNLQLLNLYFPHIIEYIIVDWGSKPGKEMYKEKEMDFIFSPEIKNIIVPKKTIETKFDPNQFYQFFAKNVGIMNSMGEYVLLTNADNILSQSLVESINEILIKDSQSNFYRTKFWTEIKTTGGTGKVIDCEGGNEKEKHLLPIYAGDFLLCKRSFLIEEGKGYDESNKLHQQHKPQSSMDGEILFNLFKNGISPAIINDTIFHIEHTKGENFDYVYNTEGYENTDNWGFCDLRLDNVEKNIYYLGESQHIEKTQIKELPKQVSFEKIQEELHQRKATVMNDTFITKVSELTGNRDFFKRRRGEYTPAIPVQQEIKLPEPKLKEVDNAAPSKKETELLELIAEMHKYALYKLNEEDDRPTHLPHWLFDKVEKVLKTKSNEM